jgi:hypothetical protein
VLLFLVLALNVNKLPALSPRRFTPNEAIFISWDAGRGTYFFLTPRVRETTFTLDPCRLVVQASRSASVTFSLNSSSQYLPQSVWGSICERDVFVFQDVMAILVSMTS